MILTESSNCSGAFTIFHISAGRSGYGERQTPLFIRSFFQRLKNYIGKYLQELQRRKVRTKFWMRWLSPTEALPALKTTSHLLSEKVPAGLNILFLKFFLVLL